MYDYRKEFFYWRETVFHSANTDLGDREPSCFFLFIRCFAYRFVSLCICLNISGLKNVSNICQGELPWVILKFLFIPDTPENAGFWTIWICSFQPNSKSVLVYLGRSLCVPASVRFWLDNFLFLAATANAAAAAEGWIYLALLLSESSLKLPPSESESLKISLILSVTMNIFCEVFCPRTWSGIFHIACGAQHISWQVRIHWHFRLECWERGV